MFVIYQCGGWGGREGGVAGWGVVVGSTINELVNQSEKKGGVSPPSEPSEGIFSSIYIVNGFVEHGGDFGGWRGVGMASASDMAVSLRGGELAL